MGNLDRHRTAAITSINRIRIAGVIAAVVLAMAHFPARAAFVYTVDTGDTQTATLAFRGDIRDGDLARLQALTAKMPSSQRVVLLLESPGGSVDEGIAIGRYIYATKITTVAIQAVTEPAPICSWPVAMLSPNNPLGSW